MIVNMTDKCTENGVPEEGNDFLEPKHMKEKDAQARLEAQVQKAVNHLQMDNTRVREAVQEYLDKVKTEKKNIPPKIPHATFNTMTTERPHGGRMTRSKTMAEMRPKSTQEIMEADFRDGVQPRVERQQTSLAERTYHDDFEFEDHTEGRPFKSCSPGPSSPPIRTRVVKRPITPTFYREHWTTWRTETPPEPGMRDKPIKWVHRSSKLPLSKPVKRVHTPPTPPPGHRHKAMATDIERRTPSPVTILRHMRSKSCPPPQEKPQVYRVRYEEDDDVNTNNTDNQSVIARPTTAGPIIAKSMIEHPRMKNWMTGATDYEKEVAYNLLHTINGGKGPEMAAKVNNIRPRSNSASNRKRVPVPKATLLHRAPSSPNLRSPDVEAKGVDSNSLKKWMKKVEKQLEEHNCTQTMPQEKLYTKKVDIKLPRTGAPQSAHHQPRIMTPEAYSHENSHFFMTGSQSRGHFVIAPDWVSEGASHRRLLRQAKENQLRRQRQLAISV
ncbi:uncharacterized protein [Antedon mediterranea]|uniref:uncharacterized protein isoform X2 n=1 Tax=Antedon mediterranea TaxID=105859 RepID=UPI003AF4A99C